LQICIYGLTIILDTLISLKIVVCPDFMYISVIFYRHVVGAYATEVKKLAATILELLCEGLGLESGHFGGKLSEIPSLLVNHYPPCPDPSLTLGVSEHCDPNLITILQQDSDVFGLQVLKNGEWIGVEPISNAFVVNMGYQMQVNSRLSFLFFVHGSESVKRQIICTQLEKS